MNVLLIGLRCSGKSTLAPTLAQRLGYLHVEMDDLVAAALNCATPGEAFAKGATEFREAEAECLSKLLSGTAQVISAGGGAPTAPGAAEMIQKARDVHRVGVLYLRAEPSVLQERLRADLALRPAITGTNPVDEVPTIFAQRDSLYQDLADMTIQVDALSTEQVAIRAEKCVRVLMKNGGV